MPTESPAPADTPRTPPAPATPVPAPPPERAAHRDPGPGPTLREPAAPVPGAPAPAAPRGYRAVFAVTEFRAVFAAHLLSLLGVVVSELALTVLVYDLTGSPLLSALTFALGLLPYMVGGTLFAGSPTATRPAASWSSATCSAPPASP